MTLAAKDVCIQLGSNTALQGVTCQIAHGEMVAIVGPNGSGKSTLVRALAGLVRPNAGVISLDNRPLSRLSPRERAAVVGLLAQSAPVPELMSVREHIGLGRHARRSWLRRWSATDEQAVAEAIEACEVCHLLDRRMEALSGGERQRVRLATLLAQRPRVLLLDEPLTGLDIEHQLGLLDMLASSNSEGIGVVCVLHDLDLALRWFPRVIVLHDGRLAADGPPRGVLSPRVFESVFGVEGRIGFELGGDPVVLCRRREPSTAQVVVRQEAAQRALHTRKSPAISRA